MSNSPNSVSEQAALPHHSAWYDMGISAGKRLVRDKILIPMDQWAPVPQSWRENAQFIGHRMRVYTDAAQQYETVINLGLKHASWKAGFKEVLKTGRENFSNVQLAKETTPWSIVDKCFLRGNGDTLASPLSKGLVCEGITRAGFMGIAAKGIVSKTIHRYEQTHSSLRAGETLVKEGIKSGLSWESGTIGAMLAFAALPIPALQVPIRIAGMAFASTQTRRCLDHFI